MSVEFLKPVQYAENVVGRALRPEGDLSTNNTSFIDASILLRSVGYTREVRNHPVEVPIIPSVNPSGENHLPAQSTRNLRHPAFNDGQSTDVQWQNLLATPSSNTALPNYLLDPRVTSENTRVFSSKVKKM